MGKWGCCWGVRNAMKGRRRIAYYSLDGIFHKGYIYTMTWDVEYTDEFGDWWQSLTEAEQESLAASVQLLELRGPALG